MGRASRMVSEKIAHVEVGDVDLVSKAAYFARLSTCTAVHPESGKRCSRAAGHDECRVEHAGSTHVRTNERFIAEEVW